MMIRMVLLALLIAISPVCRADEGEQLFQALRKKILSVTDYSADIKMKIDVTFLKVPLLKGTMYFKSPDKMRLERNGGISLLPRKNINLTLGNLVPTGNVTVIDMGKVQLNGKNLHLLKVVPEDDAANIVLSKIWVDEEQMVAVRAETTTRNDGTVVMDLSFGKYINWGLPDKVVIHMDLKDYKLPKGVTMDYNIVEAPEAERKGKSNKGTIQINYQSYQINKGIPDEKFKS